MKFMEVEFKYKADDISLKAFMDFCQARNPVKFIIPAGYDHFYSHKTKLDSFCRHRAGPDANELTFKRKTQDNNNFVRTEHNLALMPFINRDQVNALCEEFGYTYNTSLFKNCFIYIYDWYTLVYYVVYDAEMKELGRFVEIEMKEDHGWATEQEAWDSLVAMEKICKPLGISAQNRVKRSLFEMFKND